MAHDGQARRARQHHADLPAFPRPGAEPGRERLAVPPPELALKHRLRKLRRDRRRRMRGLAKAHRSTRNDHLHRNARLGSRRSAAMTLGIIGGGFRREVQPRRQHWFLNEKSGFPFGTPAFCSVSRGQSRLGEKEYRAPSVTPGVALRPRTQAALPKAKQLLADKGYDADWF